MIVQFNDKNKLKQVRLQFEMNEGSFSFLSFESQRYSNRAVQQFEPAISKYSLKQQLLPNVSVGTNILMDKPQVALLLQAAEIQRLNDTLQLYRAKFKQISNHNNYESSSKQQSYEINQLKDQLQLKNKKLNQFLNNQSLMSSNGSMTDLNKYVDKIENKYKRALKFIQQSGKVRQELQNAYIEVKYQLAQTQNTFQAFKATSIKQYQQLRDELENAKRTELSFQMKQIKAQKQHLRQKIRNEEHTFSSQKERYERLIKQERQRILSATRELEILRQQNEQYKLSIQKAEIKYNSMINQKQNAFALASMEIQRLNSTLKEKNGFGIKSSKMIEQLYEVKIKRQNQISILKKQLQRAKQKNTLYEQEHDRLNSQISHLTAQVCNLTSKINNMSLSTQQVQTEHRIKENKLTSQIRNLKQIISHTEFKFNNQIEQYKAVNNSLNRELSKIMEQLEHKDDNYRKRQHEVTFKLKQIEMEMQQMKMELNMMVEKQRRAKQELRNVVSKGLIQSNNYQRKLDEVTYQNRIFSDKAIFEQQKILAETRKFYEERIRQMQDKIREYQQKIRQQNMSKSHLFSENNSLKAQIRKQKQNIKQRPVDQMFKQIEKLCLNIKQKDNLIDQLKFQIRALNDSSKKSLNQTLYLREIMTKLIGLIQFYEQSRKQDQKSLITSVQQLFQGQNHLLDQMRYNRIVGGKSNVESYGLQSQLLKTKDSQIRYLKQKMISQDKSNVQEIIKKSVEITQQNIDLKQTIQKEQFQIKELKDINNNIKLQLERSKQTYKHIVMEKQQLQRRLQTEITSLKNTLLEYKQIKVNNEQILSLQSYKKFSQRQLAVRDQFIKQLKDSLKLKNDQNLRITLVMQEQVNRNRKLNQQINELKRSYNHEFFQKIEDLENMNQQCHALKKKINQLQIDKKNFEDENDKLKAQIFFYKQQTSRHENALISYNEKMPMLNAQFQRLQQIISVLKIKNNELVMKHHECQIKLQKTQLQEEKIFVLNNQIMRLEAQNINICEQLNMCRLQLVRDSAQERQIQENNSLFLLLFVEIQSLREQLISRQKELQLTRRNYLRS